MQATKIITCYSPIMRRNVCDACGYLHGKWAYFASQIAMPYQLLPSHRIMGIILLNHAFLKLDNSTKNTYVNVETEYCSKPLCKSCHTEHCPKVSIRTNLSKHATGTFNRLIYFDMKEEKRVIVNNCSVNNYD